MSEVQGRELSWDELIENDSPEFITLPEGDYNFTVTGFDRARHNGSDKLPPCNKAVIHIKVEGNGGISTVKHNLFLHTITEGMLCSFFTAIGQRKKGEKLVMNWNKVIGATGRAKVGINKWSNDDGKEFTNNEIKKFYAPDETQGVGFQAGRF